MKFEERYSPHSIEAMKSEIETILRPTGIHLDWRVAESPRRSESFTDVVVMPFRGRCSVENTPLLYSELGPYADSVGLGASHLTDGEMLSFAEIECDQVKRSIAARLRGEKRELLYGRALGRVVAHEFYHVFARTGRHSRDGVGGREHQAAELVSDEFRLDDVAARELRDKWRALLAGEAELPNRDRRGEQLASRFNEPLREGLSSPLENSLACP